MDRSLFGVETTRAMRRLDRKLRNHGWFVSVSAHGGQQQAVLTINVRTDDHPEIDGKTRFRGFNVEVVNTVKQAEAWRSRKLDEQLASLP